MLCRGEEDDRGIVLAGISGTLDGTLGDCTLGDCTLGGDTLGGGTVGGTSVGVDDSEEVGEGIDGYCGRIYVAISDGSRFLFASCRASPILCKEMKVVPPALKKDI